MQNIMTIKKILSLKSCFFWLALTVSSYSVAADYRLFVGEIKTLVIEGAIDRVAVGNGKLVSTSILDNGNLLVLAESTGDTELQVWLKNGAVIAHKFYIISDNAPRALREIRNILGKSFKGDVKQVGSNIVLEGEVSHESSLVITKLAATYPQIIDLTQPTSGTEIEDIFKSISSITMTRAGSKVILRGRVSFEDKQFIAAVQTSYADIVDLTTASSVNAQPMVHMGVKITEFSNSALENLGINWTTAFNGPSAGYAKDFSSSNNGNVAANNTSSFSLPTDGAGTAIVNNVLGSGAGFFGVATRITSTINLAVSTGDAIILASPTLSTRSGTEAEFLSGGEFPIPIPDGNGGTTIEFKEYGVLLKMTPELGVNGQISALIETEVSSIDQSVSVNGTPGLRTRKTITEVSLQQGETLAISGLVNRELGNDVSKVKWLGDIPILGQLFRSTNYRNNRSDLVIFITPYAYDADSVQNKEALELEKSLRQQFFDNVDGKKKGLTEILD